MNVTKKIEALENLVRKGDSILAEIAEQAITDGNAEMQQWTLLQPLTGLETVRVYMRAAKDPKNFVYKMRLDFAGNPQANECTLKILAQIACEFEDEELQQAILQNPATTPEIREILQKG